MDSFCGGSPDNKRLAFVAQRNGSGQYDIYSMPAGGGPEKRLTENIHQDDGPDYSPDGKWIYINSDRSGKEAIWRFPFPGAGLNDGQAQMVVSDSLEDWFPTRHLTAKRSSTSPIPPESQPTTRAPSRSRSSSLPSTTTRLPQRRRSWSKAPAGGARLTLVCGRQTPGGSPTSFTKSYRRYGKPSNSSWSLGVIVMWKLLVRHYGGGFTPSGVVAVETMRAASDSW
jgi:hypothetical protein